MERDRWIAKRGRERRGGRGSLLEKKTDKWREEVREKEVNRKRNFETTGTQRDRRTHIQRDKEREG